MQVLSPAKKETNGKGEQGIQIQDFIHSIGKGSGKQVEQSAIHPVLCLYDQNMKPV